MAPVFPIIAGDFKGYISNTENVPPDYLAPPSINCIVDTDKRVNMRMGYEDTGLDLATANKPFTSFYFKTYDVTFLAGGTKVKYIDHTKSNVIYDTGMTLTDGVTTRFSEFAGDIYLTNQTDGLRRIMVARVNGAVSAGASTITIDVDGAARLNAFSNTGNIRIKGTNEAFTAASNSTGALTLTGTASQNYADNDLSIFIQDISSGREKFSKTFFWKERMGGFGSQSATNSDFPNHTVFFGKFTIGNTSASSVEDIINFTYGSGGSWRLPLGTSGWVKNVIATQDYLYLFKEDQVYLVGEEDVTIQGSDVGRTRASVRDRSHGCTNEDCAADMSNGEVAYLTNDRRILRIKISTENGAPVIFPDESFDVPLFKDLRKMDTDQTGALMFYHKGKRQLRVQLKIEGQWTTFIYDNNINSWQPPQRGLYFKSYFERDSLLYATDASDDTIYLLDSTNNDNGTPIDCTIASGIYFVNDAMVDAIEIRGEITQPTTFYVKVPVNGGEATAKSVVGNKFSYPLGSPAGSIPLGDEPLGGFVSAIETAEYKKNFDVFPSEAKRFQVITYALGDSHFYNVKQYIIHGRVFPPFQPLQ